MSTQTDFEEIIGTTYASEPALIALDPPAYTGDAYALHHESGAVLIIGAQPEEADGDAPLPFVFSAYRSHADIRHQDYYTHSGGITEAGLRDTLARFIIENGED